MKQQDTRKTRSASRVTLVSLLILGMLFSALLFVGCQDEPIDYSCYTLEMNPHNRIYTITDYQPPETLPDTLTIPSHYEDRPIREIGGHAFEGAFTTSAISLDLSAIHAIGAGAFADCTSLVRVSLGSELDEIGEQAFAGCSSLTEFTVAEDNTVFQSADGVLFNADRTILLRFPAGKALTDGRYTVPDGVTEIADLAFSDCVNLRSLDLNDVTVVSRTAFLGCSPDLEVESSSSFSMQDYWVTDYIANHEDTILDVSFGFSDTEFPLENLSGTQVVRFSSPKAGTFRLSIDGAEICLMVFRGYDYAMENGAFGFPLTAENSFTAEFDLSQYYLVLLDPDYGRSGSGQTYDLLIEQLFEELPADAEQTLTVEDSRTVYYRISPQAGLYEFVFSAENLALTFTLYNDTFQQEEIYMVRGSDYRCEFLFNRSGTWYVALSQSSSGDSTFTLKFGPVA